MFYFFVSPFLEAVQTTLYQQKPTEKYDLSDSEVVLEFDDAEDLIGTLFGFNF
jgi:hypothetical protein